MEVLSVSCRQTLYGVDSSLMLLGHASPQQYLGVAPLHHRGNMRPNLLTVLVLYIQVLRPTIRLYMLGQLGLTDYAADTLTASQLQCSSATFTSIPGCHPTKNPLTLATVSNSELIAGAYSFFAMGHSRLLPCHYFSYMKNQPAMRTWTAQKRHMNQQQQTTVNLLLAISF